MVDRLIEFIYTGTYTLDQGGQATLLRHHSKLPRGLTSASYPMNLESALEFHMKMYNMGKNLQYQSLVAISHTKMAEAMLWTSKFGVGVGTVKKFVNRAYDPAQNVQDTDERADDTFGDDSLKELVVACVLRHIHQELWDENAIADFRDYVKAFPALEVDGELAEEEYKDLLKTRPGAKRAMKRARRGQQH